MKIFLSRFSWLVVAFLLGSAALRGAQSPPDTKGSAALQAVKERTNEYYHDILADDLAGAQQLVAPESKNDFPHMVYTGLVNIRILDASLGEKGDEATVTVSWTQKPPQFPQTVNHEVRNTWKLIDGKWYIVLPSSKEMVTPFGKMQLGATGNANGTATLDQIIQKQQANVDEDQYMIALQKAARARSTAQTEAKKSAEPSDDKAKTSSDSDKKN